MTVSNISSNIQMMVNSMTAQSADSEMNLLTQTSGLTGTGTVTNGFADVIGKVNTDLQDSVPAASKTTGIKSEDQETSYKKATQSKTSDSKVDKADTKKVTKDDAEEIESDIKDIIKDALSIDDEQLEKAMASMQWVSVMAVELQFNIIRLKNIFM